MPRAAASARAAPGSSSFNVSTNPLGEPSAGNARVKYRQEKAAEATARTARPIQSAGFLVMTRQILPLLDPSALERSQPVARVIPRAARHGEMRHRDTETQRIIGLLCTTQN